MKVSGKTLLITAAVSFSLVNIQCRNVGDKDTNQSPDPVMKSIQQEEFGTTPDGETVDLYTLTNSGGMEVKIITYGGRIISLTSPDRSGNYENVVLGFDNLDQYLEENPFFGALIGRYANRIEKGEFYLDGQKYSLAVNNGQNHLHGGDKGFDKVVWQARVIDTANSLVLSYLSPDMEEGYPGELEITVTYSLKDDNSLEVKYEATTSKKTVINFTQHAYFNLSADFSKNILDHELEINANHYLPVDGTQIPTGEIREVQRSYFDFREPVTIGKHIDKILEEQQLERGTGYDHCWVLNEGAGDDAGFAASAYHPGTGRLLEVFTDQPGVQLYTGNHLDGTLPIPGGKGYFQKRTGFCLETQNFPDAPNQESFPPATLEPGETFSSVTTFRFSVEE